MPVGFPNGTKATMSSLTQDWSKPETPPGFCKGSGYIHSGGKHTSSAPFSESAALTLLAGAITKLASSLSVRIVCVSC